MFAVTILGNNSALPAHGRHPTAQVVTLNDHLLLVDCGEGTQMQMSKYEIKRSKIDRIFISHMHGDHYLGLAGLLNTMSLTGRTADIDLYAPDAIWEILQLQFACGNTHLSFALNFHPLPEGRALIVDAPGLEVHCFPTEHRIPCHGFLFKEKKAPRTIIPEACMEAGIPFAEYDALKQGEDYISPDGILVKNEKVTAANTPELSYAYCADTRYVEFFLPDVKNATLLYHECTYLDALREKAFERYHSTTKQAATIALKAGAKKLLIGHFSSQYADLEPLETEARSVFPNTYIAYEGTTFEIA